MKDLDLKKFKLLEKMVNYIDIREMKSYMKLGKMMKFGKKLIQVEM